MIWFLFLKHASSKIKILYITKMSQKNFFYTKPSKFFNLKEKNEYCKNFFFFLLNFEARLKALKCEQIDGHEVSTKESDWKIRECEAVIRVGGGVGVGFGAGGGARIGVETVVRGKIFLMLLQT